MAEPNAAMAIDERDKVPWLTRIAYGLGVNFATECIRYSSSVYTKFLAK